MEKNGKNKIKLTDKVTKENLNSPQFHKWVARILAVCFILMLAVQFIGCMSLSTYASETETITLKSGTYRFNDVLNFEGISFEGEIDDGGYFMQYEYTINFGLPTITHTLSQEQADEINAFAESNGIVGDAQPNITYTLTYSYSLMRMAYSVQVNDYKLTYDFGQYTLTPSSNTITALLRTWDESYWNGIWHNNNLGFSMQTITIPIDTDVDDTYGTWFITNTNYNEVNAPSTLSMDIYGSIDKTQVLYTLNYDEGMTWREWCASEYNTINAYISDVSALDDNNNTTIMYGDIVCLALPNYDETNSFYNQTAMASYFIKDTQFFSADTVISTNGGNYYYVDTIYHVVSNEYANAYDKGYLDGKTDGKQIGYNEGYENGYWEGYQEGEYIGESNANGSNFGQNLIGNTFNGILGALNSITIYQTPNGTPVTIMGIVWGVIGIAVFIWILKLFVGG